VPIKLNIIQDDAEVFDINDAELAALGIAVARSAIDNLADLLADMPELIMLLSRNTLRLLPCLKQIRQTHPECKIIVVSQCCASLVMACMPFGVKGVLCSQHAAADLANCIRRVLVGEFYIDDAVAQILAMRHIQKTLEPFSALSSREFDVFCMLAEGYCLQSISEQLGISQKTVSNCQTQLKLKLSLENRKEMADFAKRNGLIRHKAV